MKRFLFFSFTLMSLGLYSGVMTKFHYLNVKLINYKVFDKSEYIIIKNQTAFDSIFVSNDSTRIDFNKNIVIAVYDKNPKSKVRIENVKLLMKKFAGYNQGGRLYISYSTENAEGIQFSAIVLSDIDFFTVKCFEEKKSERRQNWRFGG